MGGRIQLVIGKETSFDLSCTVLKRNLGAYKEEGNDALTPLVRRTRLVSATAVIWDTTHPIRRNGDVILRTTT